MTFSQYNLMKNRNNGQTYKHTWIVISWNSPSSFHEQPEDNRIHCNSKAYMQGFNGADGSLLHVLLYWLSSSKSQPYCWSDLIPVTVLVSLEAGSNCTVCCVVVSHPSCIVFALCVVLLGLREDVCNNACSLNISLKCRHAVGCAEWFLCA